MSVILKDVQPPLLEVAKLKGKASQVYSLMWDSACKDVRYDPCVHLEWSKRRDAGGTTHWSIKGMADVLNINRRAVSKAICSLLDSGLIQVEFYLPTKSGSDQTVFRVTHPKHIEDVRSAISMLSILPSVRWQEHFIPKKLDPTTYLESGEIWDTVGHDPADIADPDYCGLYNNDDGVPFADKVNTRMDLYKAVDLILHTHVLENTDAIPYLISHKIY